VRPPFRSHPSLQWFITSYSFKRKFNNWRSLYTPPVNSALHPSEVCNRPFIFQIAERIPCALSPDQWIHPVPFPPPSTFVAVTTVTTEEILRMSYFISIKIEISSPGGDSEEKFGELFGICGSIGTLDGGFNVK